MSALGIIKQPPKQPWDMRLYTIDVGPYMLKGDTVSALAARVYEKGQDPETTYLAEMLYSEAFDSAKNRIQVGCMGGTSGTTYRFRARVSTTAGERFEIEGEFKVKEIK